MFPPLPTYPIKLISSSRTTTPCWSLEGTTNHEERVRCLDEDDSLISPEPSSYSSYYCFPKTKRRRRLSVYSFSSSSRRAFLVIQIACDSCVAAATLLYHLIQRVWRTIHLFFIFHDLISYNFFSFGKLANTQHNHGEEDRTATIRPPTSLIHCWAHTRTTPHHIHWHWRRIKEILLLLQLLLRCDLRS